MTKQDDLFNGLKEAQDLALKIVDLVQKIDPDQEQKWRLALAIAYATITKATDMPLHNSLELVMTIYKHTEVIRDE